IAFPFKKERRIGTGFSQPNELCWLARAICLAIVNQAGSVIGVPQVTFAAAGLPLRVCPTKYVGSARATSFPASMCSLFLRSSGGFHLRESRNSLGKKAIFRRYS
ncbi:hypothetical protein KEJ17_07420, partial [Candidatus Bathyarchaeota archaeon]|nr:hypothetical protein [Candidatus Bathyarchaeota archaeon]